MPVSLKANRSTADPYLTTAEVLRRLRVNVRTVYRLIALGDLPAVRIGRQWRVSPGDLNSWLRRNGPEATLGPVPVIGTRAGQPEHTNRVCHPDEDGVFFPGERS